jgi:DNA repair photolyase
MRNLRVQEVECRTILNRSVMPFSDYTLNAYQGCAFGCSYCYVPVMRGRRGQVDEEPWGGWVQVKVNAPEVLKKQMRRLAPEASIAIGTATDSWQPLEKRYGIARRILEEMAERPNPVSLLTRSPLLLRDIDVLKRMPGVKVGVSLPTFDEHARRVFEPMAPAIPGRVHLVRRLVEAGLEVSLFWCPILYGVTDNAEAVEEYLRQAKELGVARVVCDTLNYTEALAGPHMRLVRVYKEGLERPAPRPLARPALAREIEYWADHYGVRCRLGGKATASPRAA